MANPEPAPVDGAAQAPTEVSAGDASAVSPAPPAVTESAPSVAPPAPAPQCENCGAPLHGKYCHACGQKDFDFRRSFRAVWGELLETFLNFDGKLLRGMYALLFRPGKLTLDFLAGKRVSQVPPLRFYIFLSIVTFVWSTGADQTNIRVAEGLDKELSGKAELKRKEIQASPMMQFFNRAGRQQEEINRVFQEYLPTLFLVCVPVLAGLLWMAFRRQRLTYLQHLVTAVHLQTFVLLVGVTAAGWGRIFGLFWGGGYQTMRLLGFLYFWVYSFLALRRVYGESALLTVVKGLGVLAVYWVALMFAMGALLVLALLLL